MRPEKTSSILYGNLTIDFLDDAGARIDRVAIRAAPRLRLGPVPADDAHETLLGRDEQLSAARAAVRAGRAIEFSATCGFGKSALLSQLARAAINDGLGGPSVYLEAGSSSLEDLLSRIVGELYVADQPFKPTSGQCAQLLGQVRDGLLVLDDVELAPRQVEELLRIVPGCSFALSSGQPVLGRHGTSIALPGLPDDAALELLADGLGRPLTDDELPAARQLIEAVEGQPLHLRQGAALIREGHRSLPQLAELARHDPRALDRLSISTLAGQERRALAVLALAAGILLPPDLVAAMGSIAQLGASLSVLHRRGLAERTAGRFGLPACQAGSYRELVLADLAAGGAVRALAGWLATANPTSQQSVSAASAALAIAEWSAGRGDLPAVVQLIRVAEPVLSLAGQWDASARALSHGLEAAKATGDRAAEALFSHEQGSLAFCRDDLLVAQQLLTRALELREQAGDDPGAAVTRHNLGLLQLPPADPVTASETRPWRRLLVPIAAAVILVVLGVGVALGAIIPHAPSRPPGGAATGSPGTQGGSPTSKVPGSGSASKGSGSGTGSGTGSGSGSTGQLQIRFDSRTLSADITPGHGELVTIGVTNPSAQSVKILSVQASSPVTVVAGDDDCPVGQPIAPGAGCNITVMFAPAALGPVSVNLTIDSDSSAGPVVVPLTGFGWAYLTINSGNASVTVAGGGGYPCPVSGCTEVIRGPVTLTASGSGPGFPDWNGACAGTTGDACTLTLTADATAGVRWADAPG